MYKFPMLSVIYSRFLIHFQFVSLDALDILSTCTYTPLYNTSVLVYKGRYPQIVHRYNILDICASVSP